MGRIILNCCVLILFTVFWTPALTEDKCSAGCVGNPTAPTFLNGHKYNYGVEGTVTIFLTGADKQETSVKLLGQVTVSALGNCAHVLKVQNLVISGPDGKKYSKPTGLEKPVRFTMQDGKISSEICAEEGDTRRSLNIKRAIISMLQTEQKSSTQIDVFGACPTDVSSSQEGGALLVHRTRDLSRCAHREQTKSGIMSSVFNPTAEIKNSQVLQSSLNVESKVNNGVPEKVAATEEYLYRPFSVGENGARAKVHTKLTLTGKAGGADAGQFSQARTIIFENPHGVVSDQSNYQSALNSVKETAKVLGNEASSKSAGAFAQVVRIFRATNKDDLMKVYNQVKGNSLDKRVFLDALLRAGTGYSVEASIEILKGNELSDLEKNLVFLSFGNAKHVNDESMKAAATVLDMPNVPKEVYLGVGALAGVYCREHFCHQGKSQGVAAVSQKFGAKINNCKPKSKVEEDFVVAALKGIRNIRHIEDSLIDKLLHCANDNGVKSRVRVAALEAFHADPCSTKLHKAAMDIMKNRQLDSEIRIKAYLAVIECPCGKSATEIKNLLDTEPVHQVGRFITSSLRHIRASANPDKAHARHHYGMISTPNKFNIDDRKYSFYREVSYNVDALGLGGNLEETVIYSQDSFLPRSVNFNLTTELFGHSLNILEIGGRQGNLDRVVEHFLGPRSFLRTEDPQSIYDNIVNKYKESEKKVQSLGRRRRSVKTEIDNFDKHVKAESEPFNNELDFDLYVKLFGTDALFLSLGDDKGFDFNNFLDQMLSKTNEGLNHMKHFQHELRTHLLFLDAELAYPTSTGLPLKLDLIGSATGRFDVSSNVDIRQILKDPNNAKIDVKVVPSTDIEVSGLFLVDADAVVTGLKVITNLHSSTGGHVIAKVLENGKGFDLQFGLPVDKQEILTASHDLVYVTAEKGQKAKYVTIKIDNESKDYSGCFDQLSGMIGLTLCGELSVPFSVSGPEAQNSLSKFFARYPLTGASKVKLVLEKNDLRGYHIKGVVRDDNPERRSFELLFEAEGTKNRRTHVSGELVNTNDEKTIKLGLESPIKTMSGQLSLFTKPSEYAILAQVKSDQGDYYGRVGFNVKGNEKRSVFTPVVEFQMPQQEGKQNIKVDGHIIRELNGPAAKYTLEGIKLTIPNSEETVNIDGHYSQEPRGRDFDIKAKKGEQSMRINGALKGSDASLEFTNTLNPYVNFKVAGHSEFGETIHNDFDIVYGGDLKNSKNRVTINQLLKYHKKSAEDFSMITKNKFEIHVLPLKAKFEAEVDPKKVDVEIEGQYMDKKAEFDLEARTHIKNRGDYSIKMVANADKNGVEFFSKRDIVSADKSNCENYLLIKNFAKYELSGVVLHKNKPNDQNVGAIGHFKISGGGKNEDIKFDVGLIENGNMHSSHAKVSSSQGELLDYLLKINRGANANGQLKLVLKETISANGQYKVTDNDGKGHGSFIVDFKKAQRKIKGDTKFLIKGPICNVDVDVFLNFEKDNNDKVHFTTNIKNTEKHKEAKNKLEYAGKKTELNMLFDGEFDVIGKQHANVEIVLPTERCLSFKVNRDVTAKDDVYNGHVDALFTDAAKRGEAGSTISYKAKVTNTDFEKENINYEGQVEVKLVDGRHLTNAFSFKHSKNGEHAKLDFKNDVRGNLIPHPASLTANMDYDTDIDGKNNYRLKGNYGDDYSFELTGKGDMNIIKKGDKKYLDDYTLSIHLPISNAHDIKLVSTTLFIVPENKDTLLEYSILESIQINSDLYKVDASGKAGTKHGFGKIKVVVPQTEPMSFDVNYKADLESEKKTGNVEMKATYGKNGNAALKVDASMLPQEHNVAIKMTNQEKKLDITVHAKNPSPDTHSATIVVDADGQVYKTESMVVYSRMQPIIDIKYTGAGNDKTSRLYVKGNSLNSSQRKVELKMENIRDMSLDASAEGDIHKDHVVFKANANSDKLGLKNSQLDISSKDSGNGKRLEIHATNDNKNVLSGSTSFISKQEGPKTIIEGSGSVKVYEDQKSANFKYIRTLLTEGNEQGIETFLNLAVGERSYVAESRVTNMEYKNSIVYCEEKKQCAHAELHSKINVQKQGLQHLLNVGLDLRKLGLAPEFGLQVSEEISEKKLPQYSLDLHINKEDKKYHLHVYSTPDHGKLPAGITINLPQRVLALESLVTYPTGKALPFPIKGEVTLHMDKNKPQQKTAARFLVDVTGKDKQHTAFAEVGFSHPKLGKEAVVKVHGTFHHPGENTFRIETSSSITHPTLGSGNHESKVFMEVSPSKIKFLVNTPMVKVIDMEGSAVVKENLQQGDLKFSLLEGKPVQVHMIAKDYQYYEFTTSYSDESERKLSIVSHIEPEKRVDFSADIVLPGEKKNIVHGALFIQDNYINNDYGVSKDNFDYFVNALKNDLTNLEKRIKQLGEKGSAEFKKTLQKVQPTLKKLEQAYKEDLEKLYHEISNYKELEMISKVFKDVVQFVAKMVVEVMDASKPIVENISKVITETSKKILEMYEKELEPHMKQAYENVATAVKQFMDGVIDILAHYAALVTDFFEKHKPEIQELANVFTEIFKDLTRLVVAQLKELRVKVSELVNDITHYIKEMPFIAFLKEKFQEFAVPDQFLAILDQLHNTFRQLLPTEDVKNFADALYNYVQKKLRQEKVDDTAELRAVYEKLVVAMTSLTQFLRQQLAQFGVGNINVNPFAFISGPGQTSLPSLGGPPSLSIVNQLMRGDVPDPLSLIKAYRPRSLNPLDEVPSKLRAVVVNGQHIFTFDGRHLTFPGNCRYVLTHDYVDRNFTLAIQLQNGNPKSLILEHKNGAVIELKENGQVALNGAVHGFPVIEEDAFAFRQPNGRVGLGSLYGLMAFCTSKLQVCYIEVSGFYLGKLRGLLGDGNNEPYDDFRLPNGKIVQSEAEFGNAYRLAGSCPQVKTPEHSHEQHHAAMPEACEQVFGGTSPLRPLGLVLDILPFRQACIHAATGDAENALHQACDLARGYVALALTGMLPAVLPPVCVKCTDGPSPVNVDEDYTVTLPAKQADIIVTFETTKSNEANYKKLVVPLVSQLVDNLKSKHIDDIKVYLVGITKQYPYPIIYDTDIKLKNAKVQFPDDGRYQVTPIIKTDCEKMNKFETSVVETFDSIRNTLGLTNIVASYRSVFDLPLRPTAVKHAISAVGEKCTSQDLLISGIRAAVFDTLFKNIAYTHSIVTVTPGLNIGEGKEPGNIVGYTKNSVLLLGDKKQNKESAALRATLTNSESDACVDFSEMSDGYVFSSTNFMKLNPGQQKQFLQTAATAITNTMLHETLTQHCTCTYSDAFRVRSVCFNLNRKEAASRRK